MCSKMRPGIDLFGTKAYLEFDDKRDAEDAIKARSILNGDLQVDMGVSTGSRFNNCHLRKIGKNTENNR